MRPVLTLVLSLALGVPMVAPVPARAAGPQTFATFISFCVDHLGDQPAILAAAADQGFTPDKSPNLDGKIDPGVMVRWGDDGEQMLSVTTSTKAARASIPEATRVVCAFLQDDRPDPDLLNEAAAWAGVPEDPSHLQDDVAVFVFTVSADGRRRPIALTGDNTAEILRAGGLWILTVKRDPKTPSILLNYLWAKQTP